MVEKDGTNRSADPRIHDEELDWQAVAESTVDTPQAGQQDQADEPTPTDGGTG